MSTVRTPAQITAADPGSFPVVEDIELAGSARIVADDTELGNIDVALIKQGMLVRVLTSANNGGADTWYENVNGLAGAAGSGEWAIVTIGGSAASLPSLTDVDTGMAPNTGDMLYYDGAEWKSLGPWATYVVGPGDDSTHSSLASAVTALNSAAADMAVILLTDDYNNTDLADAAINITSPVRIIGAGFVGCLNANLSVTGTTAYFQGVGFGSQSGSGAVLTADGSTVYLDNCLFTTGPGTTKDVVKVTNSGTLYVRNSTTITNNVSGAHSVLLDLGGSLIATDAVISRFNSGAGEFVIYADTTCGFVACYHTLISGRVKVTDSHAQEYRFYGCNFETADETVFDFTDAGASDAKLTVANSFLHNAGTGGVIPYVTVSAGTLEMYLGSNVLRGDFRDLDPDVETNVTMNVVSESNANWISQLYIATDPDAAKDKSTLVFDDATSRLNWDWLPNNSVIGGYMTVDDVAARDALDAALLEDGMVAWTRTGGSTNPQGFQRLSAAWEPVSWGITPYVVDNTNEQYPYEDLQDAIDAAPEGGVIFVRHSTTPYGNVNITHRRLTLIGIGAPTKLTDPDPDYMPTLGTLTWQPAAGGGRLQVFGLASGAISLHGNSQAGQFAAVFQNCYASHSAGGDAVEITSFTDANCEFVFENCQFERDHSVSGPVVGVIGTGVLSIINSSIRNEDLGDGISVTGLALDQITNCYIRCNDGDGIVLANNESSDYPVIQGNRILVPTTGSHAGINSGATKNVLLIKENYILAQHCVRISGVGGNYFINNNSLDAEQSSGHMIRATANSTIYHAYNSYPGNPADTGRRITSTGSATFHNGTEPTPSA